MSSARIVDMLETWATVTDRRPARQRPMVSIDLARGGRAPPRIIERKGKAFLWPECDAGTG
jgi:hypothetical protein